MSWIATIFLNLVGGVLAGFALWGVEHLIKFFRARSFRRFFGFDDKYYIIYCLYDAPKCPEPDKRCKLHFPKPPRTGSGAKAATGINLQQVTSVASAKGVGYLVEAFSKNVKKTPRIESDVDDVITSRTNISFVSVGGRTSYKTCDLLDDKENVFLDFKGSEIISKKTGTALECLSNVAPKHDYGFIIKMHPENNPERTWICCCGFGITGTIGAAYYLAEKWKKIRKYVGGRPFGCVIYCAEDEEEVNLRHLLLRKRGALRDKWTLYKAKRAGLHIILL